MQESVNVVAKRQTYIMYKIMLSVCELCNRHTLNTNERTDARTRVRTHPRERVHTPPPPHTHRRRRSAIRWVCASQTWRPAPLMTIDSIHGQRNPHRERGLVGMANGCFAEFCCCVPLCPCDLRYSSSKDIYFHRFPGDTVAGRECIFKSRRDMPLLWKICR